MWIFLNDAFLSIVAHRQKPDVLLVRARVAGDIEQVFARAKVYETPPADYRYRAEVAREEVAATLSSLAEAIDYDNFKASVADQGRHGIYMRVWSDLKRLQSARR